MTWVRVCALAVGMCAASWLPDVRAAEPQWPDRYVVPEADPSDGETPARAERLCGWVQKEPAEQGREQTRALPTVVEEPAARSPAIPAGPPSILSGSVPDVPPAPTLPPSVTAPPGSPKESLPAASQPAVRSEPAKPSQAAPESVATPFAEEDPNFLWTDMWDAFAGCCRAGLSIGAEGTFLAPFGEPEQTVVLTDLTTGRTYQGTSDPSLGAGIRTWLGMQRGGWGFRFQYWHFGDEEIDVRPPAPINAEPAFDEAFYLKADVIDIELTQGLCFGDWRIHSSFGGRWARLERNSAVLGYGSVGEGVNLYGYAMGANVLEGPGFTFALGGRKPIQVCFLPCGWHAYWNYRGALLWADATASAFTEANAVTGSPPGTAYSRDKAFACKDLSETVYISEVQLGLQYEEPICGTPAVLFLRAGMEYQHWQTGDLWARSNSYAFLQGGSPAFGGRVDARAEAHDRELDLIGFVIAGGLTY